MTNQSAKRVVLPIMLMSVILASNLLAGIAIAQNLLVSTTVSSFGTVSYTPINSKVANTLPTTGFGADYCLWYNDGPISAWTSSGWLDKVEYWATRGFPTVHLHFEFIDSTVLPGYSVLDYTKFDELLGLMDGVGVTVIATVFQSSHGSTWQEGYIGSDSWRNSWIEFVTYYKDDPRISAIRLFGEPTDNGEDHNYWHPSLDTPQKKADACASLITTLHAIDHDRVIVFPYGLFTINAARNNYLKAPEWIAAIKNTGVQNNPYVIYDISHPYFFENQWDFGLSPSEKALWYKTNEFEPFIAAFGADKCWVGETFWWPNLTPTLQDEWVTSIVNVCDDLRLSFSLHASLSNNAFYDGAVYALSQSDYIVTP